MNWKWKIFNELTIDELYAVLHLRQDVFIMEQECRYYDLDHYDQKAWHLLGYKDEVLVSYLRVFSEGIKYKEMSIGRVCTSKKIRGTGAGKLLMEKALLKISEINPHASIRISAQSYLINFYFNFGFKTVSDEYMEDGIPHTEMLLAIDSI